MICWNCGEKGHFRTNNTKPKKKQNHKFGDYNDCVNSAEDIGDALILSVNNPVVSWILDSGASFHSSPSKELFQTLEIEGMGDVCIKTTSGNQAIGGCQIYSWDREKSDLCWSFG